MPLKTFRHMFILCCGFTLVLIILLVQLCTKGESYLSYQTGACLSIKQPLNKSLWNVTKLTLTSAITKQIKFSIAPNLSSLANHTTPINGEDWSCLGNKASDLIITVLWLDALAELLSAVGSLIVMYEPLLKCLLNQTYCCQGGIKSRYFHVAVLRDVYDREVDLPPTWRHNKTSAFSVYWKQADYRFLISPLRNRGEYWYIPEVELEGLSLPTTAYLRFEVTSLQFISSLIHTNDSGIVSKYVNQTVDSPATKTFICPRGLAVPTDLDFHLWISSHSSFVDCNSSIQKLFYLNNPEHRNGTSSLGSESTYKLAYARDLLLNHGALPMLIGGTLLGWYRQCGTIPYTHDYDIMFHASQFSDKLLNAVACDEKVRIRHVTGIPDRSLEISVMHGSVMVDLFLLYDNGNNTYLSTVTFDDEHKMLREVYPPVKSTVAVDLNGYLFYAPSNAVEFFEAVYENWMEPVKNYVWYRSPKNLQVAGHYTREQWKQYHRTYIACDKYYCNF